jgi:hypothetical protein
LVIGIGVALAATACGEDRCDPTSEACVFEHDISTMSVAPGVEEEDTCQSWTLNNPTELWVTSITQHNDGAYHHANWFFVPDDQFALPDGLWTCSENNFSEVVAGLLGGYLFALSTQSQDETQALPAGSAIRIPPYSRIIGSSHLLNGSDQTVETTMRLAIHTVPKSQVVSKMVPARIQYKDLTLEPRAQSSFTVECLIAQPYVDLMAKPFEWELHYALSHYHNLGTFAQLEIAGGPRDGEVLMRHDGYGENFGKPIDPPVDLAAAGAEGVRFTCGFDNPRDVSVGWGIGDQEMCVVALQAKTDMAFVADVEDGTGAATGPEPDGTIGHTGPCALLTIPWDHDKPGGPPR